MRVLNFRDFRGAAAIFFQMRAIGIEREVEGVWSVSERIQCVVSNGRIVNKLALVGWVERC